MGIGFGWCRGCGSEVGGGGGEWVWVALVVCGLVWWKVVSCRVVFIVVRTYSLQDYLHFRILVFTLHLIFHHSITYPITVSLTLTTNRFCGPLPQAQCINPTSFKNTPQVISNCTYILPFHSIKLHFQVPSHYEPPPPRPPRPHLIVKLTVSYRTTMY